MVESNNVLKRGPGLARIESPKNPGTSRTLDEYGKKVSKIAAFHRSERRRKVSEARLRGMTTRQITDWLEEINFLNPKTGGPYALNTVHHDLRRIENEWKKQSVEAHSTLRAREIAELKEIKKAAWLTGDLQLVIKASTRICEIIGLNAPKAIDQTVHGDPDNPLSVTNHFDFSKLSDKELVAWDMLMTKAAPNKPDDEKS